MNNDTYTRPLHIVGIMQIRRCVFLDQHQLEQFMQYIERHTSLSANDIYSVVASLDQADLKDEQTVASLVSKLERLTNKPLSEQKRAEVIRIITTNQQQAGLLSLLKFFH